MSIDPYITYCTLVERVDAFARALRQRHADHIQCQAGCDSCCYQTFTILPLEAAYLTRAVARLSPEHRDRLYAHLNAVRDDIKMADTAQPCVLLAQGRCLLYEGRPLICRMHGYPMYSAMLQRDDGSQRDCCPLNFSTVSLDALEAESVFNLDLVNQTLLAINHQFVKQQQVADERLSIEHVLRRALCAS